MQNSHPPPFSFCLVDRPRDVFLCVRNITNHNQHSQSAWCAFACKYLCPRRLGKCIVGKLSDENLPEKAVWIRNSVQRCLSCPCKVPGLWFKPCLSAVNYFSEDRRARGQPAGQVSTVAAVSDRQASLRVSVCVAGWCQILVWALTNIPTASPVTITSRIKYAQSTVHMLSEDQMYFFF